MLYQGKQIVLATKHSKEQVIKKPFYAGLGAKIIVPPQLDTDVLGTFTGEIPRPDNMEATALKKIQLGIDATGVTLGLASEGSFGPHPANPFMPSDCEIMAFKDFDQDFYLIERLLSNNTNYAYLDVTPGQSLETFLTRVKFPSHSLIVYPYGLKTSEYIYKGISNYALLIKTIKHCATASAEKIVHLETDMRAHVNPTRRRVIRALAFKLVRRLRTPCPACAAPGWGRTDSLPGLPCELCRMPSQLIKAEIYSCPICEYKISQARFDGKKLAPVQYCGACNP